MADAQQQDPQQLAAYAEQLREQLEQASRRLDALNSLRQEKNQAVQTLQGIKDASVGDELLMPVGGTTFVNAKLAGNDEVVMGVGADYAMPRPIDKAIEALQKDAEGLGSQIEDLSQQAGQLEAEYTAIIQRLQAMQRGEQG